MYREPVKIKVLFRFAPTGFDVRRDVCCVPTGLGAGPAVDAARLGIERSAKLYSQVTPVALHLVSHSLLRLRRHFQSLPSGQ